MKIILKVSFNIILFLELALSNEALSCKRMLCENFGYYLFSKGRICKTSPLYKPYRSFHRSYSDEKNNNFGILLRSSQEKYKEGEFKDGPKWKNEEFSSPTFWVGVMAASAGVATTCGIAWWTYWFEKRQEERAERMEFLSKTRDYLNNQLKENTDLFSQLFSEAAYQQGRFQSTKLPYEREGTLKKYLRHNEKIYASLKYYDNLEKGLNSIHPIYKNNSNELVENMRLQLETQKATLLITKHLNKALLYIELGNYSLTEKKLSKIIDIYTKDTINKKLPSKKEMTHLSILYNLRALTKIRNAYVTLKDKKELIETLEHTLQNDLNIAEKLDKNNSHTYEHKFFIYATLKKYKNLKNSKAYEQEIEANAIKAYTLAPKNPSNLNVMGLYKLSSSNYLVALNYFEKASILLPDDVSILQNLARTYLHLGRKNQPAYFQDALYYAQRATNLSYDHKSLGIYLTALADCGECLKARTTFEMFKEICADNIPCQRAEKLKHYEVRLEEKCKNLLEGKAK